MPKTSMTPVGARSATPCIIMPPRSPRSTPASAPAISAKISGTGISATIADNRLVMISVMKVATMAKARKDSIAASALRRAGRGREIEGGQHDIARAAAELRVDKVGNGVEQALAAHGGERANIGLAGVKRADAGTPERRRGGEEG